MKIPNRLRPPGLTHCKRCGKELTYIQRVYNKNQYCSRACGQGKPVPICRCETCGRTFKPIGNDRLRYCSKRCSYIDNMGKPIIIKDHWPEKSCRVFFKECDECGEVFTARQDRRVYCEQCFKVLSYGAHLANMRIKYWAVTGVTIEDRRNTVCENCGKVFNAEGTGRVRW
ncbi:hypothetical protein LCGC14_1639200, partial [marine sediment metagenome]